MLPGISVLLDDLCCEIVHGWPNAYAANILRSRFVNMWEAADQLTTTNRPTYLPSVAD